MGRRLSYLRSLCSSPVACSPAEALTLAAAPAPAAPATSQFNPFAGHPAQPSAAQQPSSPSLFGSSGGGGGFADSPGAAPGRASPAASLGGSLFDRPRAGSERLELGGGDGSSGGGHGHGLAAARRSRSLGLFEDALASPQSPVQGMGGGGGGGALRRAPGGSGAVNPELLASLQQIWSEGGATASAGAGAPPFSPPSLLRTLSGAAGQAGCSASPEAAGLPALFDSALLAPAPELAGAAWPASAGFGAAGGGGLAAPWGMGATGEGAGVGGAGEALGPEDNGISLDLASLGFTELGD